MTWDVCVSIPDYEVAEYLTETEYEQLQGILLDDVRIKLTFEYVPMDYDSGIPYDSMEFYGKWEFCEADQPAALKSAIDKLLSVIDVESRWGGLAYEKMCDFYEDY